MPTARGIQRAANAEQNHPKVQLRVLPTKSTFLAGTELTGVVQLECTSDKLYLGDIWLELLGSEELQSLDHTASNVFHRSHTPFQAPHLPPSSAVDESTSIGPSLWRARRGRTRFNFSLPLPQDLPSSASLADAAALTYHLKACVQVADGTTRMVVVKIAEVHIKELLHDWEDERYLSPNRKQVSERWAGGSVALEASMPRSLWSVEEEVQLSLFVRNTSKKPLNELDVALVKKLQVPSMRHEDTDLVSVPQVTEGLSKQPVPLSLPPHEERALQVRIPLTSFSMRGKTLFDIEMSIHVSIKLGGGILSNSKDLSVELNLFVAAAQTLPPTALHRIGVSTSCTPSRNTLERIAPQSSPHLTPAMLPSPRVATTPGVPLSLPPPLAPHSPMPALSPSITPGLSPAASPIMFPAQWSLPAPSPPGFAPRTPAIPFSRASESDPFSIAFNHTVSNLTSSQSMGFSPVTNQPFIAPRSNSDPTLSRHQSPSRPPLPPVPGRPISAQHPPSLLPGNSRSTTPDLTALDLTPSMVEKVKQNLEPASNSQGLQRARSLRRHSAPTPPLTMCALGDESQPRNDPLEAIGEDGESQVGSRFTIRSSRTASPAGDVSVVSTSAIRPSGLPGGMSNVALLEDMVEKGGSEINKTSPETPSTVTAPEDCSVPTQKPHVLDLFNSSTPRASPEPTVPAEPTVVRSAFSVSKSEEGLASLERRLTKTPSIVSINTHRPLGRQPISVGGQSRISALRSKGSQVSLQELNIASETPKRPRYQSLQSSMLSGRKDDRLKSWLSEAVDATESSTNTLVKSYPSEDSIKGGDSVSQLHSVKSLDNLSPPAHRELDQSLLQTDETLAYVPSHASSDSNQSSPVPVRPTSAAHPSSSANVKELPSHKAKAFQDRTSVQHPSVSHRLDLLAANDKEEMKALNQPPPRLHASRIIDRPDPVDSDAKSAYNAKSARGGRGGQVTSVAHLWSQLSGGQSGATIPADIPSALHLDSEKTSAPLRSISPENPKTVSEIDSQKTSFDENLNAYKSSIAPAWLNTSHRDKMAMAPPSVLQPRPQQLNFRASTGSSKMPDEPAKSNLAALIAKYDRK